MKVSFAKDSIKEKQKNCHSGKGEILFRELFKNSDFKTKLEFLHETEILPNSTIGYHEHNGTEEVYYILSGTGLMCVDEEERKVKTGDAVITHSGSFHGLINIGKSNLKILVFEAKY